MNKQAINKIAKRCLRTMVIRFTKTKTILNKYNWGSGDFSPAFSPWRTRALREGDHLRYLGFLYELEEKKFWWWGRGRGEIFQVPLPRFQTKSGTGPSIGGGRGVAG